MGLVIFISSIVVGLIIKEIIFWIVDNLIQHNHNTKRGQCPFFIRTFRSKSIK